MAATALDTVLVILAAAAGWLDATAYLRLHVFTANFSGNTVLFALGLGRMPPGEIPGPLCAIASFVCGAFAGAALSGGEGSGTGGGRRVLWLELAALAAFAALWYAAGSHVEGERLLVIALAAFGMGLQQAATEALHPRPSVSTTYMSGTVEKMGTGLYHALRGKPNRLVVNGSIWIVYVVAGVGVALAARRWDAVLGFVPLAVVLAIAFTLLLIGKRAQE